MNNRILAIVLLVAGVCLLFYGMQASHSFSSGISRIFTGTPTDRTIWLIAGGLVAAVAGLFMFMRGAKR